VTLGHGFGCEQVVRGVDDAGHGHLCCRRRMLAADLRSAAV
jgi:hypothetical protein